MAPTIAEQVAVERLGPNEFVSKVLPIRLGNALPIAYGGCAAAIAVSAACASAPDSFNLYSVLGHFLGPASTEKKLYCHVESIRDTRSFVTRRVQVKQKLDNGEDRLCMQLVADFHIEEPSTLTYSAGPLVSYPKPGSCPEMMQQLANLQKEGVVSDRQAKDFVRALGPMGDYYETRYCTNGVSGQNLSGVLKDLPTGQDQRHITQKSSAEWQKAKADLPTKAANMAALAFLMDGALAFLPLTHDHKWFDDVTACSSLDFALRIFTPKIDMNAWTLRERVGSRGGSGRSYAEGRLWDEEGNLLASMTQQAILRLKDSAAKPSL